MAKQPYLCVGAVIKPQGIKGEVKIKPATDDTGRFASLRRVFVKGGDGFVELKPLSGRERDGYGYLFIEGITTPEEAEALRGADLYVLREDALPLDEGRYYIADLLGAQVETDAGQILGTLADIAQAGGNDVYAVRRPDGRSVLFPAVKDVFASVDIDAGRIVLCEKRLREVAVFDN